MLLVGFKTFNWGLAYSFMGFVFGNHGWKQKGVVREYSRDLCILIQKQWADTDTLDLA